MTQTTLVAETGIPASTYARLRTGTRPPAPRIVRTIAGYLGIPEDEAMELAGHIPPNLAGVDLREVIMQSPALTEAGRAAMLAMYDALTTPAADYRPAKAS